MYRVIKDYFRYFIYQSFKWCFLLIPNVLLKYVLIVLAKIIYHINKEHRHVAKVNLDLAFSNKYTKEEKDKLTYESYKSLLFNMYEFIENQSIDKEKLLEKGTIPNERVILDAIKEKRKIIFITAHYGGWEIALPYIALKYGTVAVVNRKMDNPHIHNMYVQARDRNNIVMLEKSVAAKGMLKALKNNQFVAVVIDQHTKNGTKVNFFNHPVMATDATSRLALKLDAVIIPVFAIMKNFRKYEMKVHEALDVRNIEFKTDDHIQELTQMQADIIQQQIEQKPELWFWQHKRWKKFHKKMYDRDV